MWNDRRRQEELMAKLDEQNAMLAQMQSIINEIQHKNDEQATQYTAAQLEHAQQFTTFQSQIETLKSENAKRSEELMDAIKGLERGVRKTSSWEKMPSDAAFWQTANEAQRPFVIPFTPEVELMLWIAHARFPTQPETSLVLPRSYARRAFVRIPMSHDGTPSQATAIPETDPNKSADPDRLPEDGYIALRLNGYAAPPTWIDTLLSFKSEQDLNMWLVWFIEDQSAPANTHIRVAVACPKLTFEIEPTLPAEWSEDQVIYFERHPSQRMTFPIPRTPVTSSDLSDSEPNGDSASESPAN